MHASCTAIFIAAALLFCGAASAQEYRVTQRYITTCAGVLYDEGGPDSSYVNGAWHATTICPATPGARVMLDFTVFDLDTTGRVRVYDGMGLLDPQLGPAYAGQELQGQLVVATPQNPTGCLTLLSSSSPAPGGGDLEAVISCTEPCPAPTAAWAATMEDTLRTCMGLPAVFDGSASTAQPGHTIAMWIWSFDDWTDTTTTAMTEFMFAPPGVHTAALHVVDETGCTSRIPATVMVLAASPTQLTVTATPETVCPGEAVVLSGTATPGAPLLIHMPVPVCNGSQPALPLPDLMDTVFAATMTVMDAEPGAVLTDLAQLGDICLDIEHTFMGDLVIALTCPNDTTVVLHNRGGGSTFLGDADEHSAPEILGTCYTYCFSATPEHGTWAACSWMGATPNVMPVQQGRALRPARYTSYEPLEGLLGCPLNGDWTITIRDMEVLDSGTLCTWCRSDAAAVDSSLVAAGPVPGPGLWSGLSVVNDPGTPGLATAVPPTLGTFGYTFTVQDSYGCSRNTSAYVEALHTFTPVLEEGDDDEVCVTPVGPAYAWMFDGEEVTVDGWCWRPPGPGLISVIAVGPDTCTAAATFVVSGVDGADAAGARLNVFPMPTNGAFVVQAGGWEGQWATWQVVDAAGRTVHQGRMGVVAGAFHTELALDLRPGPYLLRVSDTHRTRSVPISVY